MRCLTLERWWRIYRIRIMCCARWRNRYRKLICHMAQLYRLCSYNASICFRFVDFTMCTNGPGADNDTRISTMQLQPTDHIPLWTQSAETVRWNIHATERYKAWTWTYRMRHDINNADQPKTRHTSCFSWQFFAFLVFACVSSRSSIPQSRRRSSTLHTRRFRISILHALEFNLSDWFPAAFWCVARAKAMKVP